MLLHPLFGKVALTFMHKESADFAIRHSGLPQPLLPKEKSTLIRTLLWK